MSYVPYLHHVTPENEIIFWLLCYCWREQWSQAGFSAHVFRGIAGRDLTYGEELPLLRDIVAGFLYSSSCGILVAMVAIVRMACVAR